MSVVLVTVSCQCVEMCLFPSASLGKSLTSSAKRSVQLFVNFPSDVDEIWEVVHVIPQDNVLLEMQS